MKFTIAIPTYNNDSTIAKTIDSALNQNFNDEYEILILDNFSTDNTVAILESYGSKIKVIRNKETVTMYENHNLCLKHGNGDYILFCHSDDTLLSDALTKINDILFKRNYPYKYVLWGRSMFRDYYINWKRGDFKLNEIASGIKALDVFLWGGLTPSGTCYSRQSFLDVGGYLIGHHPLCPSDYVTMWKLVLHHFEFEMSDKIFFIREFASTASGLNFNNENINESILEMIQVFKNDMGKDKLKTIQNHIKESDFFYVKLIFILVSNNLIDNNSLRKKVIKFYLNNPLLLRHGESFKLLKSVF